MVNSVRLLAVAALIAATQAGVYLIDRGWTPAPAVLPNFKTDQWPLTLGNWQGVQQNVEQPYGRADIQDNWLYRNPTGDQISLLVGIWKNYTVILPHTPEYCYPASGWKESRHKDVEVPVADHAPVRARILFMDRETDRVAVMFWYEFGDHVLLDHEELRQLQQQLRGHASQLPPAIKVMLHTSAFDAEAAEARLMEFAHLVATETTKIR